MTTVLTKAASEHLPQGKNAEPMPLPYPGFEDFRDGDRDGRSFAKVMANVSTRMLNDHPDHPNRKAILELIESHRRVADMDDAQFRLHELGEANTVSKLDQDEKLHCIRTLPVSIVKKLFPHL